ncbi:uncharacterized protein G2W53_018515 [Senna tora]|uniref:Uncharacterized protein n=1 Tax=Senna tora TaxID=362788 RepID=A0A834TV59_9FABA|nr:uncharacterized protein G2W53_018515 [Senna tora]
MSNPYKYRLFSLLCERGAKESFRLHLVAKMGKEKKGMEWVRLR